MKSPGIIWHQSNVTGRKIAEMTRLGKVLICHGAACICPLGRGALSAFAARLTGRDVAQGFSATLSTWRKILRKSAVNSKAAVENVPAELSEKRRRHMSVWPAPFSLEGKYVSLEPLSQKHHDDLAEACTDGDLHKIWYTTIPDAAGMAAEIERRLALPTMLPFAILENASGKAVGMTTYMNIDSTSRRLEIGSTWYRKSVQRTPLNTECKLLLLQYAFEELDCICVELRTHVLNVQSRRAIERVGAKLDGILRSAAVMPNGTIRDTAAYSIIASEWGSVKANLLWRLETQPR